MVKLSDYVFWFISKLGVRHVFLLPGGGCMHLSDSLGRNSKIKAIGCLHEQSAVIAADGYSQYTGNIGVALVTSGPGGTNAITGIAGAWIDSTPLLVISGQVKRQDLMKNKKVRQMGVQEVDILSLVNPIVKYAVRIEKPEEIAYHLEKAIYLAKSGRPGPVWLDIPLDVQGRLIDKSKLKRFKPSPPKLNIKKLEKQVEQTINLLNQSARPVILVGRGIRLSAANEILLKLVGRLKIPVLTTWSGADFISEEHPYFFGRPGSIASRYANYIQQNSDIFLILGARLDLPQVGYNYKNFAPMAKKVMVDIDKAEIRKIHPYIDIPISADLKSFLKIFSKKISSYKPRNRNTWISKCREWKKRYPVVLNEYFNKKQKFINTYAFVDYLSDSLRSTDVIVPESSGSAAEIIPQALKIKQGQRYINSPGLGSMGYGLPQSLGACLASGGKRIISIIGDGSLQHNIQELETIKRLKLPLKLFILNNFGYASIRNTHKKFFKGRLVCCDPSSGLTLPDTGKIAHAYGIDYLKCSKISDLKNSLVRILNNQGPFICELMIDPELQMMPKLSSEIRKDGAIISKPLEDLWPFLGRDEFKNNMMAIGGL
jgi:acetolactate synthase-1/2/3 large subunit